MTIIHRPFLLEAGEQLVLSADALTAAARLAEFTEASGLEPEHVVSDPVVATPLPITVKGQRFSEVNPELLWLPLFWLPEDIALRFQIREEGSDEPRVETDTEWALRVALELQAAGLYTAENGWVDILAMFGLDIADPVDLARVEAWQAGDPDVTLDTIDITGLFAGEDEWAFHEAAALLPVALPAQFALTAASLLNALEEHPDAIGNIAAIGAEMLVDEPSDAPDTLHDAAEAINTGGSPTDWATPVQSAFESVIDAYADALAALSGVPDADAAPAAITAA